MVNNILIIVAVAIYICYSQITTRKLKPSKYTTIPIAAGILSLISIDKYNGLSNITLALLVIIIASLVMGTLTGLVTKIWRGEDGVLYKKGGFIGLLLLILLMGVKVVIRFTLGHVPEYNAFLHGGLSTILMYSGQFIATSIVVLLRYPEVFEQAQTDRAERKSGRRSRKSRR